MKSSRASSGGQSAIRSRQRRPEARFKNDSMKDIDDDFNSSTEKKVHVDFFKDFKDDFDLEDWK
jgi:hypothetical protein